MLSSDFHSGENTAHIIIWRDKTMNVCGTRPPNSIVVDSFASRSEAIRKLKAIGAAGCDDDSVFVHRIERERPFAQMVLNLRDRLKDAHI